MASQVFNSKNDIRQATPTFPSLWGDMFMSKNKDTGVQVEYDETVAALREEVRKMVMAKESKTTDKIVLIDNIERLGLSYHFEKEIEEQLQQIFHESSGSNFKAMENYDLFNTALLFRLFRQHRLNIPCGVFDKFKDADNKFLTSLENDIKGLLSFYEATDVRTQGENVLEEAVAFTTYHLNNLPLQTDFSLRERVSQALENSIHCGVPILVARYYIPIYEKEESNDKLLVTMAKLNFRYLQTLYQKELSYLTTWWKDLDIISKVPFMRDRVVECYFWGVAFDYEPQHSFTRSSVAKSMVLMTMLDDTYDTYASLEDLEIFTQVLQSEKINNEIDRLPDYFKEIYQFVLRMYEEYDNEASKQGKYYAGSYYKEAVKQMCIAYHTDSNWYRRKHLPAFEDVLSVGVVTSAVFLLVPSYYLNNGSSTTQLDIQWLMSKPKIVIATAHIGRYWNDISSYEREGKINGENLTAVDCYMKQYGVPKEEALNKFVELAQDSWMTLNKEWVETAVSDVPRPHTLKPLLNYARVAFTTYKKGKDGYTFPENALKPHILALFLDPIVVI